MRCPECEGAGRIVQVQNVVMRYRLRSPVNSEKREGHSQGRRNCIKVQLFTCGIMETKMKIVVFGTGGVGGYFGARLAQSGEDVTFIARW